MQEQEILVRIRSIDGSPVRCAALNEHLNAAGCYAVAVPQQGKGCRVRRVIGQHTPETDSWMPRRRHLYAVPVNI